MFGYIRHYTPVALLLCCDNIKDWSICKNGTKSLSHFKRMLARKFYQKFQSLSRIKVDDHSATNYLGLIPQDFSKSFKEMFFLTFSKRMVLFLVFLFFIFIDFATIFTTFRKLSKNPPESLSLLYNKAIMNQLFIPYGRYSNLSFLRDLISFSLYILLQF